MSKSKVKVSNSCSTSPFVSREKAERAVARQIAAWLPDGSILYLLNAPGSASLLNAPGSTSSCARPAKPAWGANLRAEQIPAPATDSHLAQTFLTYPQKSRDSYGGAYPALRREGAGL